MSFLQHRPTKRQAKTQKHKTPNSKRQKTDIYSTKMGKKKSNQRRHAHNQSSGPRAIETEAEPAEEGFFSSLTALRTNYLWGGGEATHSPPPTPERAKNKRPKVESEGLKLKYDADITRLRNQLSDMRESLNVKTNSHETLVRSLKRQVETHKQEAKDAQTHCGTVEAKMRDMEVKYMEVSTQLKYHQDLEVLLKTKMEEKNNEIKKKKESQEKELHIMQINVQEVMRSKTEALKNMQKAEQMAQLAQNNVSTLEATVNELTLTNQQSTEEWTNEREALMTKFKSIQDELKKERESSQNIQMRVASAEETMEELTDEKDSLHAKFISLQQKYEEKKHDLSNQAQDANASTEDTSRAVEAAYEERDEAVQQKEEALTEIERIMTELMDVSESQKLLIEERDSAIKECEMILAEKEQLLLELSELKTSFDDSLHAKEMALKNSEEAQHALSELKIAVDEAMKHKQKAINETEMTKSKLSEIMASRDEAIEQRDNAIKDAESSMNKLSLKGNNINIDEHLLILKSKLSDAIQERNNAVKETERVASELSDMTTHRNKSLQEKEEVIEKSDQSLKEFADLKSSHNTLLMEKQEKTKEIEKTARFIARLHDSLAIAETKSSEAETRADAAESTLLELKENIESLKRMQLPHTKNENITQEFLIENLNREKRQLDNLVAMKEGELKVLQEKLNNMPKGQDESEDRIVSIFVLKSWIFIYIIFESLTGHFN